MQLKNQQSAPETINCNFNCPTLLDCDEVEFDARQVVSIVLSSTNCQCQGENKKFLTMAIDHINDIFSRVRNVSRAVVYNRRRWRWARGGGVSACAAAVRRRRASARRAAGCGAAGGAGGAAGGGLLGRRRCGTTATIN